MESVHTLGTFAGNGSQPALDSFDSLATPSADYVEGNYTFLDAVHGLDSSNTALDNGLRYSLNGLAGPNVAHDECNNAVQTTGFGGSPVNEYRYPFGTTSRHSLRRRQQHCS